MNAKNIFKLLMPTVLAGATAIVVTMPVSAMAADENHRHAAHHEAAVQHQKAAHHDVAVQRYEAHQDAAHQRYDAHHAAAVQRYDAHHDVAVQRYKRDRWARPEYVPNYYTPAYGAPVFIAPYEGATYGEPCNMTRLEHVYRRDRATGHLGAANDVALQMQECDGGYAYGDNPLFSYPFGWR